MGRIVFCPIRLLDGNDPIDSFFSGNADNDTWLMHHARKAMSSGTARVYVLTTPNGDLCGYYSLSTHSVARTNDLPGAIRRNSPDPIPCTLLGQLAVDKRYQGMGAGGRLLQDALKRAIAASEIVASRALVVDAADKNAADFYLHFGFKLLGSPLRLFTKL